jgi:GNAT superfamily N-acetyltransferase
MLESIKLVYYQMFEALAEGGLRAIFHPRIFWNRLATPCVMELSTSNFPLSGHPQSTNFQFVEIDLKDLQAKKWSFATASRELKALRNLKKGFRCFAITEDFTVVGDTWCLIPHEGGEYISHPDLEMMGIRCEKGDAYEFDMFLTPAYRGKNLAMPFQKFVMAKIKMEGCQNLYDFYWNDNMPSLWMHRMLRFKELPKRRISRFFFLQSSKGLG